MMRWIAPGGAVLGSLLLCGCSAVGTPEPACRPLDVAELPSLGLIRGTWMDEERFVLVDPHESRLLVYRVTEGLERMVDGRESLDPALNFMYPVDIQPWRRGYVLAARHGDQERWREGDQERLLELDRNLRPVRKLWETDRERVTGGWSGDEVFAITQLAVSRDRLYVEAERLDDPQFSELFQNEREFAEFGLASQPGAPPGELREIAAWPGFPGELGWVGTASELVSTGGQAGSVFAVRFARDDPFIQELVGEGRRLDAFPALPTPFPESLRAAGGGWTGWGPLEAGSYPAGLYADRDSLYVLVRDATGDAVVWDLHRIDPEQDAVVGKVRLPTNAPHVGLIPGRRYWLLQEATSGVDDPLRPPLRLLLLDTEAVRAGEVPSCD